MFKEQIGISAVIDSDLKQEGMVVSNKAFLEHESDMTRLEKKVDAMEAKLEKATHVTDQYYTIRAREYKIYDKPDRLAANSLTHGGDVQADLWIYQQLLMNEPFNTTKKDRFEKKFLEDFYYITVEQASKLVHEPILVNLLDQQATYWRSDKWQKVTGEQAQKRDHFLKQSHECTMAALQDEQDTNKAEILAQASALLDEHPAVPS